MRPRLQHERILASAGTGKTHALVNRYLRLVALGESPARIIALTFTRKAAGEFLQKIFLRLGEAAASTGAAADLARQIGEEMREPAFFRQLLDGLVREMGSLQLGTIDSFFARVVSAFPYELGLTRPHRIMDTFEQDVARRTAMERLLAGGDPEREQRVLQLYKDLTWGAEEKNVYGLFEDRFRTCHDLFLEAPDARLWGAGGAIFTARPWWMAKEEDMGELAGRIRDALADLDLTSAFRTAFHKLLDAFAVWQPGQPLEGGTLLERLLAARAALGDGVAEIEYNRRSAVIGQPLAGLLHRLLQAFVRREIGRRLLVSQSLGALMAEFDALYEESVREAGSLVFADLPMLLVRGLCGDSRLAAADIIYRLDGQTDHWLVDEFQDTSRIQWRVLSAFVDEVLQDSGGRRTFFHVGDAKQSIYGWRGGDARLFDEIVRQYGAGPAGIACSTLSRSWRSAPQVLDCVNALFGDGIRPGLVSAGVAARWGQQWARHEPSPKTAGLAGHAAWGLVADPEQLPAACIELVRTADPLGRGLSCAVLMRRNTEVAAMTQALRAAGIPASMEGVAGIALDNVVGTWILAFLYSLARPDEPFPRAYLGLPDFTAPPADHPDLAARVRAAITGEGYTDAIRLLLGALAGALPADAFLQRRGEQLLEAAARYEGSGMESLEGFIEYLATATVAESTLRSQVQVMTVHKAKGLDFDMVIVAGFGAGTLVQHNSDALHVQRDAQGAVEWIMDLPNKQVLEQDPRLLEASAAERDKAVFEALCLLYVAMTRARLGLYCVAAEPARNSSGATWHQLFESAFESPLEGRQAGLITWRREWGAADWFERAAKPPPAEPAAVRLTPLAGPLPAVRPVLRGAPSPSREAHAQPASSHPLRSTAGRDFGTRVHEFLAGIDWIDFTDPEAPAKLAAGLEEDIARRLQSFLASPLARKVFTRPAGPFLLWREKPYVLRKRDTIAHGIIDRALILLDPAGQPARVVIQDYKTDVLDPLRPAAEQLLERYGLQVERYIEAAAILTGLAAERITAQLVPV